MSKNEIRNSNEPQKRTHNNTTSQGSNRASISQSQWQPGRNKSTARAKLQPQQPTDKKIEREEN